jgi:surface antigen
MHASKSTIVLLIIFVISWLLYACTNKNHQIGDTIDHFEGVAVYYNGKVSHVKGRNLAPDGYNFGLKYQCVEFVKRFYYEALDHKMPNSYGHAKDFYQKGLADGRLNPDRGLVQYSNPSKEKPKVYDLLVFDATTFNPYGHVAIVSKVDEDALEIIQQNPGRLAKSRVVYKLKKTDDQWRIEHSGVLGWLRKE